MIIIQDEVEMPILKNWERFGQIIQHSPNDILRVAHTTVRTRLGFADMHLSILGQAKKNQMKRAMSEDVIINLVSTLEATAHILNSFYAFGIEYRHVTIDHKFPNNEERHKSSYKICLRCRLTEVNAPLAEFLDKYLKTGSPIKDWYKALIEYRHQILHRQHVIAHQIGGVDGYFLPDDPKIMGVNERPFLDKERKIIVYPNFTQNREIKKYTQFLYKQVRIVTELIYIFILAEEDEDT
jgi:hypothetical protein